MSKGSLWSFGGAAAAATILGVYSLTHKDSYSDGSSSTSSLKDRRKRRDRRRKKDRADTKAKSRSQKVSAKSKYEVPAQLAEADDQARKHRTSKHHTGSKAKHNQSGDDGRLHGSSSDDSEIPTSTKHRNVQRRISYDVLDDTLSPEQRYESSAPRVWFGVPAAKQHRSRREEHSRDKRKHRKSDKHAREDPRVRQMREADAKATRQPAKQVHFKSPSQSSSSSSSDSPASAKYIAPTDPGRKQRTRNLQESSRRKGRHSSEGRSTTGARSSVNDATHSGYAGIMEDTPSESSSETDWTTPANSSFIPAASTRTSSSRQSSSSSSNNSDSSEISSGSDTKPSAIPVAPVHTSSLQGDYRKKRSAPVDRSHKTKPRPEQPKSAFLKYSSSSSSSSSSSISSSSSASSEANTRPAKASYGKQSASEAHQATGSSTSSILGNGSSLASRHRPGKRSRRGSHRMPPSPSSSRKAASDGEASKASIHSDQNVAPTRQRSPNANSVSDDPDDLSSRRSSDSSGSAPKLPAIPDLNRRTTFDGLPIPPEQKSS